MQQITFEQAKSRLRYSLKRAPSLVRSSESTFYVVSPLSKVSGQKALRSTHKTIVVIGGSQIAMYDDYYGEETDNHQYAEISAVEEAELQSMIDAEWPYNRIGEWPVPRG